ncbi:FkbM family methyltransferase [candidate division CSSED10-310 bacterium]|uniref:FkbM family methyltransferase n=1 Tax=candidate division CSSED10-310 bacterium TaxID=2855610 RepID=A0ABV6Z5Q8_UNCC1
MSDYLYLLEHILEMDSIQTILDVGSRDGLDAIFLCEHFPNARIISFECHPDNIKVCAENIANSNSSDRITLVPYAVGNECKKIEFYPYPGNVGASSMFIHSDKSNRNPILVDMKTIESVLKELSVESVDIVCMDIQGFELYALKGMKNYLERILYIQTEIYSSNDRTSYIGCPSRNDLLNFLSFYNFMILAEHPFGVESNVVLKNMMVRS